MIIVENAECICWYGSEQDADDKGRNVFPENCRASSASSVS